MKRFSLGIASGLGVLALGAFLFYQPVAGGASGSGELTVAPAQPVSSPSQSVEPTPEPTSARTSTSGSASASLQGNSVEPPTIKGSPRGDHDDDEDVDDDYEEYDHEEEWEEDDD